MSRDTYNYKRKCLGIARDFHYPKHIINSIKNANSTDKIADIMTTARKRYL